MKTSARVIVVLEAKPANRFQEIQLATQVYDERLSGYAHFGWTVSVDLPKDMGVHEHDQLEAHKRDAGDEACYMTVYGVGLQDAGSEA